MTGCNALGVFPTLKNPNPLPTNNNKINIPDKTTPNSKWLNFLKFGGKYWYKMNIATNIISNLNVVEKKNSNKNITNKNIPRINFGNLDSALIIFSSFCPFSSYTLNKPKLLRAIRLIVISIKIMGKLYSAKLVGLG